MPELARCPDCGTALRAEPGIPGLCPQCLLSLALQPSPAVLDADPDDPDELVTLDRLDAGRILGERYQIRELLGRGGMGEVFRAFDLKLRVDVALKAVRPERIDSERGRELLRQEVRSAREVLSPNVCRIFDLVAEDGQELVSMEFVDGETLAETLVRRGPLALGEARDIASQFLAGLEAIHQAGLVHRDFKPENVMLTRAGRVVVMDFGLAKARSEDWTGTISGTPAYMAPEHARGDPVDARADVFAAGVVLTEMLSIGATHNREARQALWREVRETPPKVPEGPWAQVLRRALSPNPEERQGSARELARGLEEVTQRLPGFETKRPYPGLASFTEEDAEYFFGRELEVEALWKKLRRPRLLMLAAPSGAGKSSFLRAGLLPTLPKGWKPLVATPGDRPFQALARRLVPAFAGDTQATEALLRFEDEDTAVSLLQRFRQRHEHALLIVDQFEELFTLNPPTVQAAFAHLLGRLVLEADLHVILSLRDDFLLRCREHEALAPAFSDLTALGSLDESALRRALVQPALACGYRFEDEALVGEMVGEVQKERGALPLLAFAASRLWEKRDHDRGLLTRQAYREIGGVAGALAQHAEATLERIGTHRTSLVRELLRNLVTAQGTRAVREREELMSVFGSRSQAHDDRGESGRAAAEDVLSVLIDARFLTSYERPDEGGATHQQIEIIHESLLSAWPRLVRWQTQDADGAQLRDQLRQAAQLWQDRGKTDDLLWSGAAYRDFALWRERHPVPLTAAEDAFAQAMEANATRRRRRRRAAVAALMSVAASVAVVTSVLWQRADASRRKAEAETLRAEAGKLVALGQPQLDDYPTATLAYAIKSLELADTEDGRLLALQALQRGPLAFLFSADGDGLAELVPAFSHDGTWLAIGGYRKVALYPRDGSAPMALGERPSKGFRAVKPAFSQGGDILVTDFTGDVRAYSIPEGRELWSGESEEGPSYVQVLGEDVYTSTGVLVGGGKRNWVLRRWDLRTGASQVIGTTSGVGGVDSTRRLYVYDGGPRLFARDLLPWGKPRRVAEHAAEIRDFVLSPDGRSVAASDASGEVRIWPLHVPSRQSHRSFRAADTPILSFDPTGRRLAAAGGEGQQKLIRIWDLTAPHASEPVVLRRSEVFVNGIEFDPTGRWLVTTHATDAAFWPLPKRPPLVLSANEGLVQSVAFTADGRWVLSTSQPGFLKAWPVTADAGIEPRVLLQTPMSFPGLAIDNQSRLAAVSGAKGHVFVVPVSGGPARELRGFTEKTQIMALAFSPDGRQVAAAPFIGPAEEKVARVWDLEAGGVSVLGPFPGAGEGVTGGAFQLRFLTGNRLVVARSNGFGGIPAGDVMVNMQSGEMTPIEWPVDPDWSPPAVHVVDDDETLVLGHRSLTGRPGSPENMSPVQLVRCSLAGGSCVPLPSHGSSVLSVALDPTATIVATGSDDGSVRIGPVSGDAPHLLFGHVGLVRAVRFSPDGRWLASAGEDRKIRLWPVPDVSKPPLHTRPLDELLATLRSCTNLRVEPDPTSRSRYRLTRDQFPGWEKVPDC